MTELTATEFQEKLYDYKQPGTLIYKGLIPAVVYFYTPGTFMDTMFGILDDISKLYLGKINFYAIDVNKEIELATEFAIRAVPTMLLIALQHPPFVVTGVSDNRTVLEDLVAQIPLAGVNRTNIITDLHGKK